MNPWKIATIVLLIVFVGIPLLFFILSLLGVLAVAGMGVNP
jgi:hypothetical protein